MSVLIERIQERLAACKTNPTRASAQIGLGKHYLRDIIYGRSQTPGINGLAETARVLGCSVAYLIGETDELEAAAGPDPIGIGGLIRAARKAKDLGQADIADQLGVTVQAVSQWERSETMPSGINLLKLSGILGIELPHGVVIPGQNKLTDLREQIEEITDLLHALDKIGDGIGGADGFAVSAVALNAKYIADNVLDALKAMEGSR